MAYDRDFCWNTRADLETTLHCPTSHETNTRVTNQILDQAEQDDTVITVPVNEETDPFIIQLDNGDIIEAQSHHIKEAPSAAKLESSNQLQSMPHIPWILLHGAKVTMVPPNENVPKQGYL